MGAVKGLNNKHLLKFEKIIEKIFNNDVFSLELLTVICLKLED